MTTPTPAQIFRYPVRSADVWGLNDSDGVKRSEEDIAADLDFQDNAVEDYLSNTVPTLYTQLDLTTGTIEPSQLAGGTPGAGKAPVGDPPIWTDIATQSELDAHITDISDAHAASAITFTPYSTLASTNVQSAIQEIIDEATSGTVTYTTPAIVLGTAAAAGVSATVIRSDATILAFDATSPSTQAIGDAAAVGVAAKAARRDHKHAMPSFSTNAVVLGTAASAGVATTLMRSDDTILAFDATAPTTSQIADVAAAGSANFAARRDHVHGREDLDQSNLAPSANETIAANYSAVVVGQYTIASGVLITIASGGVLAIL